MDRRNREEEGVLINVTRSELPGLEEYVSYLTGIWRTHWLTNNGELVQELERRLLDYFRVKNLAVVANGTLALQLAFKALKLTGGGEVITTPFTFAATTNALLWEGLQPVFADIDSETYNISAPDVEERITPRTTAILAVHVYGNPCDVEALQDVAVRHGLPIIYDAAHAFGVDYQGKSVLEYGDISTMSFHATKVFQTIEGGAVITRTPEMLSDVQLLRNFGIASEEDVVVPGINAKMNEFEAAMGLCNLVRVDAECARRGLIYEKYKTVLSCIPGVQFQKLVASLYNYAYMPVRFSTTVGRDAVYDGLMAAGIRSRKYFCPLTTQFEYWRSRGGARAGNLEKAEGVAETVLCLPIYSELTMPDVERIGDVVAASARACS
jgi:dTDP-4-amino-4,6-dideoxygalactose transaminase